jgi:RHS repeat-associated protein
MFIASIIKHSTLYKVRHKKLMNEYSFGSIMPSREYTAQSIDGYRFGFNGKENTNEIYGEGNGVDFGERLLDTRLGRWLNTDKLEDKYPFTSPYTFALNSPIFMIDRVGNDNIVYLVVLPSAYTGPGKITKADVNNMVQTANAAYKKLGLKTEVRLVSDPTFNPKYIDPNDRVSVVGDVKKVKAYIAPKLANNISGNKENPDADYDKKLSAWNGGTTGPEISQNSKNYNYSGENGGKFIAIDGSALKSFGDLAKGTVAEAGAYLTMHGMGHTVGINHNDPMMSIMREGGRVLGMINGGIWGTDDGWQTFEDSRIYNKLTDFMDNRINDSGEIGNWAYTAAVVKKLGSNDAKDNYNKNKDKCEEKCTD